MAYSIDERQHRFTYDEYLTVAGSSEVRLEYWAGLIFDMAGGSPRHSRICANVLRSLGVSLRGKACQPYDANLRLRSLRVNRTTYADVAVVCGALEIDPADKTNQTVLNPKVVFEVASPSTERDDRGAKLDCYMTIPSVEAIVLVAQDRPEITVHMRQPDASWRRTTHAEGHAALPAIGCTVAVEEVYADLPPG